MSENTTIQERESEFWDKVVEDAGDTDKALVVHAPDLYDKTMPWLEFLDMEAYVQSVINQIGARPGLKVLDLGCGKGFLAIALAHRGCDVVAIDISPKSIERCQERARLSGLEGKIDFRVMDCESTEFADDTFDAVCGSFVLHHLDLKIIAKEITRVIKPGGKAAFIETIGLNPILMLARSTLPGKMGIEKASSDDEYPLNKERIAILSQHSDAELTLEFPHVVFMRMGGYLSFLNNAFCRSVLKGIDRVVGAIPFMKHWSYYGVVKISVPRA